MISFRILSFAQMDMKAMDMKKDTVPASQKKKVTKKISTTKSSSSKKDTIKALNDPMMNMDTTNKTGVKDTTKMSDHDMKNMDADTTKPGHHDMSHMNMNMSVKGSSGDPMTMMNDAFSLNLPMERHGSGTGWLPDTSPMNGYMFHSSKWMYMLHGNLFLRYNNQDFSNKGSRGGDKFDAPSWFMFMGQRKVGEKNIFHFSSMFSLDPLLVGGYGYPLLFQSGEAYKGKALVDRQHPHDLFSELSVSYSHAFSKNTDAFIYVGYPGEPALGPVAFMHRPSAFYNPDAPLSHHWSDATHITFGVATLGVRFGDVKLDGSLFTGREPNDKRYDFDTPKFDSYSGRLSYNPSKNWALQVSHGFIKSPEELHPDEDVNRTTASAIYSLPLENEGWINVSSVYGLNKTKGHSGENSFLFEASWKMKSLALYSKYEYVEKSVEELSLDENIYGTDVLFPVNAFTLGLNYDVLHIGTTNIAAGGQFSYYHADKKLNPLYGKNPMAFEAYLRIYPSLMKMHGM
jgi:hypothetical protein